MISIITQVSNAQQTLQQQPLSSLQPAFIRNMDLLTVKENTPIGEVVYTLEAQVDLAQQVRILYGIEGTSLFSVDKSTGQVKVAQLIDREQTSDSVTFQVSATALYGINSPSSGQSQRFQAGPTTRLTITVLILDENDNPPKIERVKIGRNEYDSSALVRQTLGPASLGGSPRSPIVRTNISEGLQIGSTVIDLIEAIDVDKASSNPLRSICLDCEPEFELRSATDNLLNDRLNSSIVLVNPAIHVPRNNVRYLNVIVNDGKFNSTILIEVTIEDVQNKPPQFIGSTTCIVHENVPIDKTIMTIQAVDGDAVGPDDSASFFPKGGIQAGRQIIYDLMGQVGGLQPSEEFKLHPLSGQLQVANRLDRESYLGLNGVLTLRVRARELIVSAESVVRQDDLYDLILDKLSPYTDQSPDATSEIEITVILVDENDNEPHWLNASEISKLNMNQSPDWYNSLPNDRDTGRIYQVQVEENSLAGSPITTKNEMFVYDLDNGANANFNITLMDPFGLFDVEPKQISGFAIVTLKLIANTASNQWRRLPRLLDFENPNERSFIIQLIATETSTNEKFSSKAQVQVNVIDVNDNAPEFKESAYHANIREDAPPGKTVLLVQATDKDEVSKQLIYSLHGRSSYLFDINRRSGLITVAKCEQLSQFASKQQVSSKPCIDFELQRSHHLMVEVSDGELATKVPLTVFIDDASDNPPIFTLPIVDVVIEEGADRLDPPIKIEATDVDQSSTLSYSIVEGNFEGLFSINNATGELQLTRPIRISHEELGGSNAASGDYRQQQLNKMTLIIQATDGVFSTNGTIRIDVLDANDNAPKFLRQHYTAEIYESISPGQLVTTVRAIDSDRGNNARISYRLLRGSYGQFDIDESTGAITVSEQARYFDTSKRANYSLEVVAYDHGLVSKSSSALVHVHVLDTTRKPPIFEPQVQRASICETTLNNTIIHRMLVADRDQLSNSLLIFEPGPIEALNKNGQPVASTDSERLESMFSVSTNTGDVMVNSDLDHDFASFINLTIFVSSRKIGSIENVSADFYEQYNPRSAGYLIITVIDDNSNAPIFALPWSPQQPELSFQMLEELPVGSVLTQLVASDKDSKISHFKIDPPNEYFELASPQSGVIVNKKLIDYDTLMSQTFLTPASHRASSYSPSTTPTSLTIGNSFIQFNVYVFDSGMPQLSAKSTVSVEILPVNDWDCKFERSIYEARVKENVPVDTLVLQVRANDLDYGEQHNSVRYQLLGEYSECFNIDAKTGLLTVSSIGSVSLDRERLSHSTIVLTVLGRDDLQLPSTGPPVSNLASGPRSTNQQQLVVRSCSATVKIHIDDVNDNPPVFSQKLYECAAYDTDATDVPLVKLIIRDDDSINSTASGRTSTANSFRIISGNVNDSFNVTNNGLIYATKALNESLATMTGPIQLRVQVKQQSPTSTTGVFTSFTDECLVRINYVKINRYGPEWQFDSLKSISVKENSRPGTLVTRLRCLDRDYEPKSANGISDSDETVDRSKSSSGFSPIRYWIKINGSNVAETREFKLDPISGNLVTKIELDRESQEYYQLIVTCEDNGRPQSLESVVPLFVSLQDVDDNRPEFVLPRAQDSYFPMSKQSNSYLNQRTRPVVNLAVEEQQTKGLAVGELKAIDRDIEGSTPISYCLIEGNEFKEFSLDRITGILYTNQTLDREKQSSYDLLVKAINDGSSCDDHMVTNLSSNKNSSAEPVPESRKKLIQHSIPENPGNRPPLTDSSLLWVKVEVLDINDNAPIFSRAIYRAGVHHRSLMNTLVTQVAAFDPDLGLNGTLSYRISEILMYKISQQQHPSSSRKYEVSNEQPIMTKPIKLIQYPFRIDPQGNLYTQQLLTQYQLMSMFVLQIEAFEQAEPWRTARTKLEIYVYETSSQLKIRINLHPRLVENYRLEIENLLSNATRYTAIINRARSYNGAFDLSAQSSKSNKQHDSTIAQAQPHHSTAQPSVIKAHVGNDGEPSFSNIHLIFVDNLRIVNPNIVMEKFDLTSAQLFMPQLLTNAGAINSDSNNQFRQDSPSIVNDGASSLQSNSDHQRLQVNEVASLIDKIALASVQSADYQSSASLASIDWLESPSVLYVTITIVLMVVGFLTFLFGCCCTSRIKDHIVRNAMEKLVRQHDLQAKINEQMLATSNQTASLSNGQEYILHQGGFMSSFDATKGCVSNNNENMNILQRAMESGEYIDPNYVTMNGQVNMGAYYYDASELEQANGETGQQVEIDKRFDDSNNSLSLADGVENDNSGYKSEQPTKKSKPSNNNASGYQNPGRQRQQIPNNT